MNNLKTKFFLDQDSGKLWVNLYGSLCSNEAKLFNLRILRYINNVKPKITLDLRSVTDIDETGLESLISLGDLLEFIKMPYLILASSSGKTASVIRNKQLDHKLPVCFITSRKTSIKSTVPLAASA